MHEATVRVRLRPACFLTLLIEKRIHENKRATAVRCDFCVELVDPCKHRRLRAGQ